MIQTFALLLDAYRELQSKKLFSAVLILNLLVMAIFATLGVNDHTMTFLGMEPMGDMAAHGINPLFAYKFLFSYIVVGVWLTWIAALLALISTAGIYPDFLVSGSVDLYLSRPIGRLRLFLTKYFAALLFVIVQITLFTLASFFVLGIRGHLWEPGLFWAIPIVGLFFSYLFAICTLLGVFTRSTLTALCLTLLCWAGIWGVDWCARTVTQREQTADLDRAWMDDQIDSLDAAIAQAQTQPANAGNISNLQRQRERALRQRNELAMSPQFITLGHIAVNIKTVLPKTHDTIAILDRVLFKDQELQNTARITATAPAVTQQRGGGGLRLQARNAQLLALERQNSIVWIVLSSLLFEAACLGLAAWRFCKSDF